jgi:hypothetical protein
MHPVDLTTASGHLMAASCRSCTWWQRPHDGCEVDRAAWERAVELETGFFGKALMDDEAVLGWVQAAPANLVPFAWRLPAGPPSADAWLLTCAFFYDDEFLRGFLWLLQELQAALKQRQVTAVEAFALHPTVAADRFRGYLRERNLFNHEVLEGSGFRAVRRVGDVRLYRLELATLIAAPRWAKLGERLEKYTAAQPV